MWKDCTSAVQFKNRLYGSPAAAFTAESSRKYDAVRERKIYRKSNILNGKEADIDN